QHRSRPQADGGRRRHVRRYLLVAFALGLSFSSASWGGDARDDTLQGTWLPSSAEFGGQAFPDEARKSIQLVVKDDTYTVTVGKVVDRGTIKRMPSASPKAMDIIGTD